MGQTILIVVDDDAVRSRLREWMLSIRPSARVVEAGSGEEALAISSDQPPDLALIDLGLPGVNGIETTRRLMTTHPRTRVVIVSAHPRGWISDAAAAAGADAWVSRSALHRELPSVLQRLDGSLTPRNDHASAGKAPATRVRGAWRGA